ncbi:DUF998 domain-containing protein [Haloarchaeobius amylolyticus]|uniref:DUF998 domain-containing protein n=1 Tax=Haloarchaeobius amylolyticus TaxID=1198296 RepID=A0ABD6BHA3_9EURY
MANRARVATYYGVTAPAVALGAIVLATIIAPPETFTWQDRALSEMGRYGSSTFFLFNGGLIAGGLLGLPFVWHCWATSRNAVERLGVVLLAIAVGGLIGVGVFFLEHTAVYVERSLHGLAALSVFGVAPFASWVYGSGAALAGDGRLAVASVWFGNVHPLAWLGWLLSLGGRVDTGTWFAVPEFVAAVAFGGWIVTLAVTRRSRDDDESADPGR